MKSFTPSSCFTVLSPILAVMLLGCTVENPSKRSKGKAKRKSSDTTNVTQTKSISARSEARKTKPQKKSDKDRLLGSWRSTRFEQDGKVDPTGSGGKAIFSDNQLVLHGLPFSYTLDSTKQPKYINTSSKGIYLLDGNMLTLCISTSSSSPRPTEFKTVEGDGRQLIVFERLSPLDPKKPDEDFDQELKDTIREFVSLLKSNRVEEFLNRSAPPRLVKQMKESGWKEAVKTVSSRRIPLLNVLRVLPKIKPSMNANETEATFDLSRIHIENGWPSPHIKFIKENGRWYIGNE